MFNSSTLMKHATLLLFHRHRYQSI